MKTKYYYHFTGSTMRDGRPVPKKGRWLIHKGELEPCESGLHASEHPLDALRYAPGPMLHLVQLDGEIIPHGNPADKVVARKRKIVKSIDATDLLRRFARRCALDVIHLWKAPDVVRRYLETGDELLLDAALAAAGAAACDAAGDVAWDVAWAAAWAAAWDVAWDVAWAAAGAAAWDVAWDVAWAAAWAAARAAAGAAAGAAAWDKYRIWFKEMVDEEFGKA